MSRYTSATDADRAEMLAEIGVGSVEELFAEIPEPLRLQRPLELPDGLSEPEVFERLAALAERNADADHRGLLHRRRDVRPLRAGDRRRDHPALGIPHPLHALPARGLPGRAAGDVRVPDRDVGADRASRLQRRPLRGALDRRLGRLSGPRSDRALALRRLARGPSPQPRDPCHLCRRLGRGDRRGRPRRRRSPTRPRWPTRSTARPQPCSCRAQTSSARSRTSRRSAARPSGTGRCSSSPATR